MVLYPEKLSFKIERVTLDLGLVSGETTKLGRGFGQMAQRRYHWIIIFLKFMNQPIQQIAFNVLKIWSEVGIQKLSERHWLGALQHIQIYTQTHRHLVTFSQASNLEQSNNYFFYTYSVPKNS